MTGYVAQDTKAAVPSADVLRDTGEVPNRPPPLQRDTTADMVRMYNEEDKVLKLKAPGPTSRPQGRSWSTGPWTSSPRRGCPTARTAQGRAGYALLRTGPPYRRRTEKERT